MRPCLPILLMASLSLPAAAVAADKITFKHQNLDQALATVQKQQASPPGQRGAQVLDSALLDSQFQFQRTHFNTKTKQQHTTYQQSYHGIPVLGGKITIHSRGTHTPPPRPVSSESMAISQQPLNATISGQFIQGIEVSPSLLSEYAEPEQLNNSMQIAINRFNRRSMTDPARQWNTEPASQRLVLAMIKGQIKPLHHLSFYANNAQESHQRLISMYVDANNPDIVYKVWDNLQHKTIDDTGHGGNNKTVKYTYGEGGLPHLQVKKMGSNCKLENNQVKVVNALEKWYSQAYKRTYSYKCGHEQRDQYEYCTSHPWWLDEFDEIFNEVKQFSGNLQSDVCYTAYSQANDAYYFGQVVYDVYHDWYDTQVLASLPMTMRVHVGTKKHNGEIKETMANAYWDPALKTMNFGDGLKDIMYPLVSIDIAAHEVSHGFTQEHANLSYFDETGALNEAFSDMAGAAAMAYVREMQPALYQQIYHTSDQVWKIGPTLMVSPFDGVYADAVDADADTAEFLTELDQLAYATPIRFMDQPSLDKFSADCYDKVDGCGITYQQMVDNAYEFGSMYAAVLCDPSDYELCVEVLAQSAIVHEGSGVFNKAFYLLANQDNWTVRQAFEVMLSANRDGYWIDAGLEQDNYLNDAACATVAASKDLGYDTVAVRSAFQQVGLLLPAEDPSDDDNELCPV